MEVNAAMKGIKEEQRVLTSIFRNCSLSNFSILHCLQTLAGISILLNAVTIGVQSDFQLRGNIQAATYAGYVNWVFVCIFVIELGARIFWQGRKFFSCGRKGDVGWNLFDLVTISCSVLDMILELLQTTATLEFSYLRIVRVLRFVHAFRAIRIMHYFRDLRIMVSGVLQCSRSLLWACALLALTTYVYAVMVASTCSSGLQDGRTCKYGSMLEVMFLLFKATTGGVDWGELADYLQDFSPLLTAGLCGYIVVVMFVVLNVITAVFVQAAFDQTKDPEEVLVETLRRRHRWLKDVTSLFAKCDLDHSGYLDVEEVIDMLGKNEGRGALNMLGIDADLLDFRVLDELLDKDADGRVSLAEFAHCLQGLAGVARSSDISVLRAGVKRLEERVARVASVASERRTNT